MLRPLDEILFHSGDLREWLDGRLARAEQQMDGLTDAHLSGQSDEQVVASIAVQYAVASISWESTEADIQPREEPIDVSDDPRRVSFSGGPVYVPGTVFTYIHRFGGTGQLFKLRPSTFNYNPPRGTVEGNTLRISVHVPSDPMDIAAIDEHVRVQMNGINSYLSYTSKQVEEYGRNLQDRLKNAITRRRSTLSTASTALEELRRRQQER